MNKCFGEAAQLVACLSSMYEAQSPVPCKLDEVAHAYNFSTQEVEAGGPEVQSNLWLHSEFEATPQCMRLCLKDSE